MALIFLLYHTKQATCECVTTSLFDYSLSLDSSQLQPSYNSQLNYCTNMNHLSIQVSAVLSLHSSYFPGIHLRVLLTLMK